MDLTFPSHTFYGVEFPAVVNNVETAIEMLGGLSQISEVCYILDNTVTVSAVFFNLNAHLNFVMVVNCIGDKFMFVMRST